MKYSIIVPVYNVESYIEKCLLSLKRQRNHSFEVLVINDGSTDSSLDIINRCVKDDSRFLVYTKENGDISDARNYGIERARGQYLLFVDGDDFVSESYLEIIDKNLSLQNFPDILRFQTFRYTYENGFVRECLGGEFSKRGVDALKILIQEVYFDVVWLYAFRRDFFEKYHFRFTKGRRHEDFGLIPYIILKAERVVSISTPLYYYVLRENSIITTNDILKQQKKMEDLWYFYSDLKEKFEKEESLTDYEHAFFNSYLANVILKAGKSLDKKLFKKYLDEIKIKRVYDLLLKDTFFRKIKYFLAKHFTRFYVRFLVR